MSRQQNTEIKDITLGDKCAVKDDITQGIRVTVRIPENMSETSRRQKINRIYDILKPDVCR